MAAKKRPQKNLATPAQSDLFHKGKLVEELEIYKRQREQLRVELQKINAEFDENQAELEKNQAEIKKRSETESILRKTINNWLGTTVRSWKDAVEKANQK
jgi:hypothetical protein